MTTAPLRVAVLASGRGSNLGALLQARARGELPVEFVLVGSDKADAGALTLARDAGIPTLVLTRVVFPTASRSTMPCSSGSGNQAPSCWCWPASCGSSTAPCWRRGWAG
jgi:hypothetical protein